MDRPRYFTLVRKQKQNPFFQKWLKGQRGNGKVASLGPDQDNL